MKDFASHRMADITVRQTDSMRAAMTAIGRGAVGIALVVDEANRLIGTLTDGDVRRALLVGAALDSPVGPHIVHNFTGVGVAEERAEVLDLMRARGIEQVPIVDGEGRLIGLHVMREIIGAVRRPNWAVIMAGGRGERLRPLTDTIPKPMVKVAGRPILERIVLHLVSFGIRRIFLSVNYLAGKIEDHFGDGSACGCAIEYLREDRPLGTGGSLSLLPERPKEPVLVLNGDLITQCDVGAMLARHCQGGFAATMGVHEYVHDVPYAVVDVRDGSLTRIVEKPTMRWLTNAGIYVLNPVLLERVRKNTPSTIPDLFEECLERGEPVGAFFVEDDWVDVGRQDELKRARGS